MISELPPSFGKVLRSFYRIGKKFKSRLVFAEQFPNGIINFCLLFKGSRSYDCVRLLLDGGADVNHKDRYKGPSIKDRKIANVFYGWS